MKINEGQQLKFLPLILFMLILENFRPLIKLFLLVKVSVDLVSLPFASSSNQFSLSKLNCSLKKESEKLKKSHFGQIHVHGWSILNEIIELN